VAVLLFSIAGMMLFRKIKRRMGRCGAEVESGRRVGGSPANVDDHDVARDRGCALDPNTSLPACGGPFSRRRYAGGLFAGEELWAEVHVRVGRPGVAERTLGQIERS